MEMAYIFFEQPLAKEISKIPSDRAMIIREKAILRGVACRLVLFDMVKVRGC